MFHRTICTTFAQCATAATAVVDVAHAGPMDGFALLNEMEYSTKILNF